MRMFQMDSFQVWQNYKIWRIFFFIGKLWNAVAETFIDCTLEWGDRRARSETVRKAWALVVLSLIGS